MSPTETPPATPPTRTEEPEVPSAAPGSAESGSSAPGPATPAATEAPSRHGAAQPSLPHRVATAWRGLPGEASILAFLCAFSLFARWITLEPIELSGDPLDYWYFVRQWSYPNDITSFNHHDARFGIHSLLWLVQKLFGEHPKYTYVAPLFASTVVTALTYVLGRLLRSRAAGLVSAVLVLEFDPFIRASSQIRPSLFSAMYVMAAAVCLVLYCRAAPERRLRPLIGAGTFAFFSYLAHEPNLFFLPGMVVGIWLGHRRWRDCALFTGVLVAAFVAETSLHWVITEGSRLASVENRAVGPRTTSLWQILDRMTRHLEEPWKLVFYPFFVSGPAYFVTRRGAADRVVALLPAGYLFLAVFAIRRLEPLRTVMPMNSRYLDAAVPFCILCSVLLGAYLAGQLWEEVTERWPSIRRHWPALGGAFAVVVLVAYSAKTWSESGSRLRNHPVAEVERAYGLINDAYARGLPVLAPWDRKLKRNQVRAPGLHWAAKGFVRSDLLLTDGKLLRFDYYRDTAAVPGSGKLAYFPASLDAKAVAQLRRERPDCVVELGRAGRFSRVPRDSAPLPADCPSLRNRQP